jgi:DNA-binding NarL/FixJ family response regulator
VSIRVLIADDQALVRGGFRRILDAEPDVEVVAEAGDGAAGTLDHPPPDRAVHTPTSARPPVLDTP